MHLTLRLAGLFCLIGFCLGGFFSSWGQAEEAVVADPPAAPSASASSPAASSVLADYIAKEDLSSGWVKVREGKIGRAEYVELILTSQTWRGIVWKHRLLLIKPPKVDQSKQAVMVIAGGAWKDKFEDPDFQQKIPKESALFGIIAEQLQSPLVLLLNVPQQPIFDGLVEDAIISLTFDKYLETEDPEWPLLLPMVKSAVRGMDAAQDFCKDKWSIDIDSFTVTGASKRGWTTWLVGAIDERVTAIAPMVIDMLGMDVQMEHQIDAWGKLSHKIKVYTDRDIPQRMDTPAGKALRSIVDPFSYRDMLTQPKLIIIGTNDHYWPIDALNLYWDDLVGQKHILYVPNNRHGLKDFPRVLGTLGALHEQARGGEKLPDLKWSFDLAGEQLTLQIDSDQSPKQVNIWTASSDSRDFRESKWTMLPATENGKGYVHHLDIPEKGYKAILGEAVYQRGPFPFYLSTNVRVISAAEVE